MSVSRENVIWCYEHILGRSPESESVIDAHLHWPDTKELALAFVSSEEFLSRRPRTPSTSPESYVGLPTVLEKLDIEVDATADELALCAAKIKNAWEHLGDEKAHYSVLSNDAYLPNTLDGVIDQFWASGELEVNQAIRAYQLYGGGDVEPKVCVEYGCGVGRLTGYFAKSFKYVHAYDISRKHLDHARERTRELRVSNVAFHECAEDFRVAIEPCDFFYSAIVLQHNPPPVIVELIRIALSALKPGGVAMFQVPTYIVGYRFCLAEWLATEHVLDMQMHCVPQETILKIIATTGCRLIELREDGCTGARDQIVSNTFFCRK
jgi:SAM-dependent methyltransferase